MQCVTADVRIMDMYRWFRSAISHVGAKPAELKCKDLTRSYTYRALVRFSEKADELGFDDRAIKIFMTLAAKCAKNQGMLRKGAYILTMPSVYKYVCDELERVQCSSIYIVDDIKRSQKFIVDSKVTIESLTRPVGYDGYPFIVHHYKLGSITGSFLSVSKICRRSLGALNVEDRNELPTNLNLELMRIRIVTDPELHTKAKSILKLDLIRK